MDPLLLEALREVDEIAPAAPPVAPPRQPRSLPPGVVQTNDKMGTYLLLDGRTVTVAEYHAFRVRMILGG